MFSHKEHFQLPCSHFSNTWYLSSLLWDVVSVHLRPKSKCTNAYNTCMHTYYQKYTTEAVMGSYVVPVFNERRLKFGEKSLEASWSPVGDCTSLSPVLGVILLVVSDWSCCPVPVSQAQLEAQRTTQDFQRATEVLRAAKETIALAEQRLLEEEKRHFDSAWQEMLNHATQKVSKVPLQSLDVSKIAYII